MTTVPEPRIRTDSGFGRCVRRYGVGALIGRSSGAHPALIGGSRAPPAGVREPVEHGERVERPGGAFGVVLDRLDGLLGVAEAFHGTVVEVELGHPEAGGGR